MGPVVCTMTGATILVLISGAGQVEASNYIALVGESITIQRPSRPTTRARGHYGSYVYNEYDLYRNNIRQTASTGKLSFTTSQLVIENMTLGDGGTYQWQARSDTWGHETRSSTFNTYVFDYIQASDVYPLVASPNKTLLCEYRYEGANDYSHVTGYLGVNEISATSSKTTSNGAYRTTKKYFKASGAHGKSFKCKIRSSSHSKTIFSETITLDDIGQAEPSKYIGLVGENTTVGRPSRPPYAGFTEYFPHRNLTQQRNNTLMDVMTPSQLVLVNTTLEDSGGYLWQSQSSGNGGSILLFHIYVFDYIHASDVNRHASSLNKTLLCEYRYQGVGAYTQLTGYLGDQALPVASNVTTWNGSYYTTKVYYQVSGMLGKSFRCEAGTSSQKIVSGNITIGVVDRLLYPGDTFRISANVSDDRYLSLDINDSPVLAGNLPDFMVPGHTDRFQVTSQENSTSALVTLSVANVTYSDSGIYRWYLFGQGTFGRVNLVIAEEPQLIIPTRVVAGETVQLKCRLRYFGGNASVTSDPKFLIHSFIEDEPLSVREEIQSNQSNVREITQIYTLHACADHHLKNFGCWVQLVTNPHEVHESVTELHVSYPPTWVEVSPPPRGVQYLVDTTLECQADANPPPEYFWTNTKTNERVNGSKLLLDSSFVKEKTSRWECTAINVIHGEELNASFITLFRTVAVQDIELPGPSLVLAGSFATVSADIQMLTRDILAIENNEEVIVALGGPYNGTYGLDKYVLSKDRQSATLLIRNAMLNDSGSYRWSVFGTAAVARANVIVTEEPKCLVPAGLTSGQMVNLTCLFRFGIGTRPSIQKDEHPHMVGLLAGRTLLPQSTTVRQMTNGTMDHTMVFLEMTLAEWNRQIFTCRLTLPNAVDEVVGSSITLSITGETPLNRCLTRHQRSQRLQQQRRRRIGAL